MNKNPLIARLLVLRERKKSLEKEIDSSLKEAATELDIDSTLLSAYSLDWCIAELLVSEAEKSNVNR